jgi:ASCH domain
MYFWTQFGYRVSPDQVLAALEVQGVIVLPARDAFGTEDTQAWITLRLKDAPSIERSERNASLAVHILLEGLGETMRALSVRQPWAEQILNGEKDVENRSYLTHPRGPLLIHASKTMDVRDVEDAGLEPGTLKMPDWNPERWSPENSSGWFRSWIARSRFAVARTKTAIKAGI